jgi:hypothetical protein
VVTEDLAVLTSYHKFDINQHRKCYCWQEHVFQDTVSSTDRCHIQRRHVMGKVLKSITNLTEKESDVFIESSGGWGLRRKFRPGGDVLLISQ